jgi:SHS2 domain-containing protein
MDYVPLPQRPPRRKRPRPAPGAPEGAPGAPPDGKRPASDGAEADATAAAAAADARRCPPFAPGVPIFDGTAPDRRYEYRDHTADIQIHSWGATVEECFAWAALGMMNYMTPLSRLAADAADAAAAGAGEDGARVPGNANMRVEDVSVSVSDKESVGQRKAEEVGVAFEVEAHDAHSLLFAFLDELLFRFHTDMTVCRRVQVGPIDRVNWRVRCVGRGERFVDGVHEQGTEIKAITYSAMQIVDRAEPLAASAEGGAGEENEGAAGGGVGEKGANAELFVIVDI